MLATRPRLAAAPAVRAHFVPPEGAAQQSPCDAFDGDDTLDLPPRSNPRSKEMRRMQTLAKWLIAATCALPLIPLTAASAMAQQPATTPEQATPRIPDDQLDSLVAPIALYPDPLLAQVLAASTYPLELVQLQQWLAQHADLKDQALVDAVAKQAWDPSVQAMAALPDVVKLLANDIKWTTDLGNAFLAQESDVMDAVQRMRMKAKNKGVLKSSPEIKVATEVVESKTVVVIEQANPQVVYVPSYNPTVVYGAPVYPYPSVAYPVAGMALSFGVGVAMGAAFHGGWGYHAGWGGHNNNNININTNNNFVRNSPQAGRGSNSWQHNPQHRGGAPYGNQATAQRYGGRTGGASAAPRPGGAGQARPGGAGQARPGGPGQPRPGGGQQPARQAGAGGARAPGGGDRVGNRSVPSGGSRGGAFGGGSSGYSGDRARASSSRGAASAGGRGGGGRGGGGGRRR